MTATILDFGKGMRVLRGYKTYVTVQRRLAWHWAVKQPGEVQPPPRVA